MWEASCTKVNPIKWKSQ